ncbi:hypothetical protein BH23GEM4_BH23GEM4_21970 [soil metagenome]
MTSHNLLHAPLVLGVFAAVGVWGRRSGKSWGTALLWFTFGCALHTLCDVVTHHDDGPLLLFPFDWSFRFSSPISYWNPAYHGRLVGGIEHLLDAAVLLYFAAAWWRR